MIEREDYFINNKLHQDNSSFIYGEIYSDSFINILHDKYDKEDISYNFVDIGSGCGRLCIDLYNSFNFNITGIEIDENRYDKSQVLCDKKEAYDRVELINTSFKDVYFGEYDILYCCNTIFSNEDNLDLYNKIIKEFKGSCFLYTYNNIMLPYFIKKFVINTSWVNNTEIYLFVI